MSQIDKKDKQEKMMAELAGKEIVRHYLQYEAMGPEARDLLKKEWNEYFQKCEESQEGRAYKTCCRLLKAGRMADLKDLSAKCKARWQEAAYVVISQPRMSDPVGMTKDMNVRRYIELRSSVNEITQGSPILGAF
jgi:hypothetical protein